jgi:ABC-type transporter Mla MlaB component
MSKVEPSALKTERDGEVLRLSGRLGLAEAGELHARGSSLMDGIRRIDLAAVDEIDSAGVAALRLLQKQAAARGQALALAPVSARFRAICAAHRVDLDADSIGTVQ